MSHRNGSSEKGMDLLKKEWIQSQRNRSSKRGYGAYGSGIEYPIAWMCHLWSRYMIKCLDALLRSQGVPLLKVDMSPRDLICYEVTWYTTKWHDMLSSDRICHQVIGYATKWQDMPSIMWKRHSFSKYSILELMPHLDARMRPIVPWHAKVSLDESYAMKSPMILKIVQGSSKVEDAQGLFFYVPPWFLICHGDLDVPLLHHDMPLWIMMPHHMCSWCSCKDECSKRCCMEDCDWLTLFMGLWANGLGTFGF